MPATEALTVALVAADDVMVKLALPPVVLAVGEESVPLSVAMLTTVLSASIGF